MSQFVRLGFHCNITYLSQEAGLKRETGLFEYLESDKLQSITDIVMRIKDRIDTNIVQGSDRDIHVLYKSVRTCHYNLNEYKVIFERRANRFLDLIRKSNELVFVRINPINQYTTEEEINNFCRVIHLINSSLNIKFLVIHTIDECSDYKKLDDSKIVNTSLVQGEFLLTECPDVFLRDNMIIQEKFLEYLKASGVAIQQEKT